MFLHKNFMPYVVAFYRQAAEEKALAKIIPAASAVIKSLKSSPELISFLKIPFIPFEDKISILEFFFPKNTHTLFLSFLTLLGRNRKLYNLEPILSKFIEYADHKSGREHINVTSAYALTPPTKKALQQAIEEQLERPIELFIKLDPSLIGGIIIHYYHHELDLSLKNGILSLKSSLKELYS